MFPLPDNHNTRLHNITQRFNRDVMPYVNAQYRGEIDADQTIRALIEFTNREVMDGLTQEDLMFFARIRLAEQFKRHVDKVLKEGINLDESGLI